ncbi:hypothetical protein E1A91_A10G215200v1 [Gossypium mustelinum]|uniref:MATH domain-containing protein n=1 Tax=Gossypium mustelinum TaxID=34275 RepID=A0A5D2XPG9_GOSMU|nr:hypothetical protein E1A91_A10G215200v1 [Gossypium mustelinum]TYJ15919.1 hypothetical protein E1A91_A10G215200v1 [Gossypium mustelinum]
MEVTWKIEVLSDVPSNRLGVNGQVAKVTWRIENFSSMKDGKHCSEIFTVDGNNWQLWIYPKGDTVGFLSIYLHFAGSANLASKWTRHAHFRIAVIDRLDRKNSKTRGIALKFEAKKTTWGFRSLLSLTELRKPERGYLLNDVCLIEAYVVTYKTDATVPKEEDINTFFTSLESKFLSSNTNISPKEVKEALADVEKALNMTPVIFSNSGKLSSLTHAFKILASFGGSSTTLTVEQKQKLLAIEKSLKKLADRAAKVSQDKNSLTGKESDNLMVKNKLDRNRIKYKEFESEVEKKLAALRVQVKEAEKKRDNMLAEVKEMEKKMAKYEAEAKNVEEEEKSVEAEWGRIKASISSIKGKI